MELAANPADDSASNNSLHFVVQNAAKAALGLGGYWIVLIWHLSGYWLANPQYSFGWAVPLLTLVLIVKRWNTRPPSEQRSGHPRIALSLVLIATLAFFPTWIIEQPSPDWRLVAWALALEVLALTSALIYWQHGRKVLLHFAFPLLFFLTAVPWPFGIEWAVIQGLTRWIVNLAVDTLNIVGVGAIAHGSLIEISRGTLDVVEGCSGIKSLQASLMVSLFLGDFYGLAKLRRINLIVFGTCVALITNFVRVVWLACIANHEGISASASWHDSAGVTIMVTCLILVWVMALALSGTATVAPSTQSKLLPTGRVDSWICPILLGAWLASVLTITEFWYRAHENAPQVSWRFNWPTRQLDFKQENLSEDAAELLHYDYGKEAHWRAGDGTERAAIYIKWNPGASRSRITSRSHRPEICLAASGYTLESDFGEKSIEIAGIAIPFEQYLFKKDGVPVDVFFCLWQDQPIMKSTDVRRHWGRDMGLLLALNGQRRVSQQVLEIGLFGYASREEAGQRFQSEVLSMIERDK